jgi:hypothetical protein|tara:strand:- start:236 stop:544 length:309 start_codon:yes stop_codon:yes gene_type:complete
MLETILSIAIILITIVIVYSKKTAQTFIKNTALVVLVIILILIIVPLFLDVHSILTSKRFLNISWWHWLIAAVIFNAWFHDISRDLKLRKKLAERKKKDSEK